jgi:hypothetical protein
MGGGKESADDGTSESLCKSSYVLGEEKLDAGRIYIVDSNQERKSWCIFPPGRTKRIGSIVCGGAYPRWSHFREGRSI